MEHNLTEPTKTSKEWTPSEDVWGFAPNIEHTLEDQEGEDIVVRSAKNENLDIVPTGNNLHTRCSAKLGLLISLNLPPGDYCHLQISTNEHSNIS